jgi:condensin complex subunit 2
MTIKVGPLLSPHNTSFLQIVTRHSLGINFQKASCTLDGCVKVWTSRVDSVATETGKLLSGLSTGRQNDDNGEDEDDLDPNDPTAEENKRKTKKTRSSGESTLAKSFDVLKVKKLDLEFTVDPLFKKTSADFDEGGAMGLLMNHLGVDGRGRVVFDAGDVGFEEEGDEEEEEDAAIDLDRLRGRSDANERDTPSSLLSLN